MSRSLTASVAVVRPGVSTVTYSVPAAAIEYIELASTGYLDSSGRYQYATDLALILDAASKSAIKSFAESVSTSDSVTRSKQKNLLDSVLMQDSEEHVLVFLRDLADLLSVPDATSVSHSKPITDSVSTANQRSLLIQKFISDLFALNDSTGVGDGIAYVVAKSVNNLAFVSDASAMSVITSKTDSVALSESGSISIQDYCDITYFAEDYVGFAQSF